MRDGAANDPLVLVGNPLVHDRYTLGVCADKLPDERIEGIDTVPPGFVRDKEFCSLTYKCRTDYLPVMHEGVNTGVLKFALRQLVQSESEFEDFLLTWS
jgi:hypothetical protein